MHTHWCTCGEPADSSSWAANGPTSSGNPRSSSPRVVSLISVVAGVSVYREARD